MTDDEWADTLKKYHELQVTQKNAENDLEKLKKVIKPLLKEKEDHRVTAGGFIATLVISEKSTFQTSKFKVERPKMYEKYCEVKITQSLLVK